MRKLALNLDDLSVESFAVTPETEAAAGTVEAFQQATGPVITCSSYVCGGGYSDDCESQYSRCGQDTCYPVCENEE